MVLGTISRQEVLLADTSQELFSPELAIMEPAGDRAHFDNLHGFSTPHSHP